MLVLGVDVGGSSIKAAPVDVATGVLAAEPLLVATPQPATPVLVVERIAELVGLFDWRGPVGCGFPAVIRAGVVGTAVNVDDSWIGVNAATLLAAATGCSCKVINDADAAGLAEMQFGAGQGLDASVLVLTLGTGIGSALFYHQQLFPNLELGSLPLKGTTAELYAAAAVRRSKKLSWKGWSARLNLFLAQVERLLTPESIIIGGGVSQRSAFFFPHLVTRAALVPARLLNHAGMVGAACHAARSDIL
ncbi:MAG: ROK family protein [Pelovirga sp.]